MLIYVYMIERWAAHLASQTAQIEHRFEQLKDFWFGDMIEGYVFFAQDKLSTKRLFKIAVQVP